MSGRIASIHASDVLEALQFALRYQHLQGRDLLHLAMMQRLGISRIVSADRAFDGVMDIERLDPADFEAWRESTLKG